MARLIDQVFGHRDTWARLRATLERGQLPHAMTFSGPAGVGKKLVARALAQTLLCEREAKPCGECGSCLRVEKGQSESVLFIAPEKNQIKLEAAREILNFLSLRRVSAARVILIDGADRMNAQTANACLKVMEEPPPGTHFILITPEASLLMPTMRSRSQTVRFGRLSEADLARGVRAATQSDDAVEPWMLNAAGGSFERLAAFRDPDVAALRETALAFLRDAILHQRAGLSAVLSTVKDRERTLTIIQFLQRHLRDWSVGESTLDDDRPASAKVDLWRHSLRMEYDFNAHVDRSLIFQNFFNQARAEG